MNTSIDMIVDLTFDEDLVNALSTADFLPADEVFNLLSALDACPSSNTSNRDLSVFEVESAKNIEAEIQYLDTFDVSYLEEHDVDKTCHETKMTLDELINILESPVQLPRSSNQPPESAPSHTKEQKFQILSHHVFHLPEATFRKQTQTKKRPRPDETTDHKKKSRTVFRAHQLEVLEDNFKKCGYLSKLLEKELAQSLGMEGRIVKIWFQNRRNRQKRAERLK